MAKKKPLDFNSFLKTEVAEKFEVKLSYPKAISKFSHHRFGVVDLKTLSLKAAEQLVNLGADFIALKQNEPISKPE